MIQYRKRDPSSGNKGKYNNKVSRGPISKNPLNASYHNPPEAGHHVTRVNA